LLTNPSPYCAFRGDEVHSTEVTGFVACYLGVAYALYLLDHNAELQARLISRLKNPGNFHGAYYIGRSGFG
jgi:hypothetical protein